MRLSVLFQNSTIPIIENAFFLAIVNDSGLFMYLSSCLLPVVDVIHLSSTYIDILDPLLIVPEVFIATKVTATTIFVV